MPPPKWEEVVKDPSYQVLDEDQKSTVRQRYWNNVVSADPGFQALPDMEQMKVQKRFFGEVKPDLTDNALANTKSMLSRAVSNTADFLYNKPAAGAEVLKNAAVDAAAPTEGAIVDQAAKTGDIPYGKIAERTAAMTVAKLVPLTPTELAATILGGKALDVGIARAAPWLADTFPRLTAILKAPIGKGFFNAAEDLPKPGLAPSPVPEGVPPVAEVKPPEPLVTDAGPATPPPTEPPPAAAPGGTGTPPPTEPPAAILNATPPAPEKDIFGQQLSKFNVSENGKAIFDATSKEFAKTIDASRRGVIDFAGTKELADNLGMDTTELIKRNAGTAFNAEQLEAAKGLVGRSLEDVNAARTAYQAAATPENLVELNRVIARHALVQDSFLGARAEAGRALSILRKTTDPAAGNIDRVLQAIGGKELNEEMATRLSAIDPTNIGDLNRFVRDSVKATTAQQVYEVWLNGVLSSPLSHVKNMAGNTMDMMLKVPEKVFRGVIDMGAGMFTGERTAYVGEAPAEVYGLLKGIPDGVRRAMHAIVNGVPEGQMKLELERIPALGGTTGEILRLPTKMLTAEDEFAKGIVARMELSARAYRAAKQLGLKGDAFVSKVAEIEANPPAQMQKEIADEVLVRTFQNKGGKIIEGLKTIREAPGVKYLLPFLQTPGNIAGQAIARSPLGFIKVASDIINKQGQEKIVEGAAKAMLGSTLSASVALYALQGRVTGSPPTDATERDRFFRSGKLPYAIKIKDRWYSYAAFEPASMIIGATADATLKAVEAQKNPDVNVVGAILTAIPRYMVSRTFLSGVRDLIDGMADGERYGSNLIERFAGSTVPMSSFMRYITYQLDPVIREPQSMADAVKANVPGMSKTVQPKLDVYGQPATRPGWQDSALTGALANVAIPSRQEKVNPLDIEDDLAERRTGFPARTLGGVKLLGSEYTEVLRRSGTLLKSSREQLKSTEGWDAAPPESKKSILDALTTATRKEAKLEIFDTVLDRLPAGDRRNKLIEYGVNGLGLKPDDLMQRKPAKK